MKYSLALVAVFASSTAMAENITKVKVFDHTEIVTQSVPVTETRCQKVQVPIYQQSQGASGGDRRRRRRRR